MAKGSSSLPRASATAFVYNDRGVSQVSSIVSCFDDLLEASIDSTVGQPRLPTGERVFSFLEKAEDSMPDFCWKSTSLEAIRLWQDWRRRTSRRNDRVTIDNLHLVNRKHGVGRRELRS
jgi:hypothetical protein